MSQKRDHLFEFAAVILILSSVVSLALSFINLNNLVGTNFYDIPGFQVESFLGKPADFCYDQGLLAFCWTCGILSFVTLVTGIMAFGVEDLINFYNLVFLFLSGISGLIVGVIIIVFSSMVCTCHVAFTGELPASNLFISIMAVFQIIFSLVLFFKVFKKRVEMNSDIKYGIEPLPDPFELTINPRNISYVQGANKYNYDSFDDKEFYDAIVRKGGRFDSTFNKSQFTSNPTKFQISNGVKRQIYTNEIPSPVMATGDRRILNAPVYGGGQQIGVLGGY